MRGNIMPMLLFYFPIIIWVSLIELAQEEMRRPAEIAADPADPAQAIIGSHVTPQRAQSR
jgi:hypothetical protein